MDPEMLHLHARKTGRVSAVTGRVRSGERRAGARLFNVVVAVAGTTGAILAVLSQPPAFEQRAILFVLMAIAAGFFRFTPPTGGTLSLAYPFVFATLMGFGVGASTVAAALAALLSRLLLPGEGRDFRSAGVDAAVASIAASMSGGLYLALGGRVGPVDPASDLPAILGYTAAYSFLQSSLMSLDAALSHRDAAGSLRSSLRWSVPGFVAGSALATLLDLLRAPEHPTLLLLAAPFAYLVRLAYGALRQHAEERARHSQETAELYRAVTEALAMAIEAKDENTEGHVHRVQQYCLAVGEQLCLPPSEMEALKAASLLHDIGKVAVPAHILTKPGRLTPEEAETMMAHAKVGAEILGAVPFPYPLASVVRHHHERWDGNGYPDGLAGESIPLGARILAAADCYDALTSERPYRRALSRNEALRHLTEERGGTFDPAIVDIVVEHADELERRARAVERPKRLGRETDACGAEAAADSGRARTDEPATSSPQEIPDLYAVARTVGHQLDLDDCLTLLSAKLASIIPFRSLVVYLFDEARQNLVAHFTTGDAAKKLRLVVIPVGERLSGWAALHQRAYIGRAHVNPVDRDGSRSDLEDLPQDAEVTRLASALVAPLSTERERLGVIALYHDAAFRYDAEHRRLLVAVAGHIADTIRNSFIYGRARTLSLTDPLTGVPNARFFFLEAERRIERAMALETAFGVMAFVLGGVRSVRESYGDRAAERMAGLFARRLAAQCSSSDTLVRFGSELFVVLTEEDRAETLVARSRRLADRAGREPLDLRTGVAVHADVHAAQCLFPEDGRTPDQLLDAVEVRLSATAVEPGSVLPFGEERLAGEPVSA